MNTQEHERYELVTELGRGGMGVVYKARDRDTGTMVAIKVLHPEIAGRAELIERFKTELVLARKITHKNVCRVYDLTRFGNGFAISMEYIEGESLRAILSHVDGLSIHHGLRIIRQVMDGLAEAHSQGVIHRDLKPENILIARDGTVKVMDFGIARSIDTDATLTGTITGTPSYMSPEQATGKSLDARSDIYSLGMVMYEVFCGRQAFTGDTAIAVALKQVQETPPPPAVSEPHLPGFLERAILKCIEKNPAKRFQSIGELEAALSATQERTPGVFVSESPEPPLPIHLTRWQRNDWLLPPLAVVGLLLFFPFFQRTSFAPRIQVSFDRAVLTRIAMEHAGKVGAPIGGDSRIELGVASLYEYVARQAGAAAALELTNNPVPYVFWRIDWDNGTSVAVDSRGSLQKAQREFTSSAAAEPIPMEEARTLAEKGLRLLDADASALRLERAGESVWLGHTATQFSWSDPRDLHGLQRHYIVRLVGKDIASLETNYEVPRDYERYATAWQILPLLAFDVVLLVMGLFLRQRVNLYSRWRIVSVAVITAVTAWGSWLIFSGILPVSFTTSVTIFLVVTTTLAVSLIGFLVLIPVEWAVRRMASAKEATMTHLFDRRALSEPCGLGILRGTLVGLLMLGVDAFLVWLGTSYLGMRLDSTSLLGMQGLVFLINPWPSVQLVSYPLLQTITTTILIVFLAAFLSRLVRRSWLVILFSAAVAAVIFPGPMMFIAAVQPYYGKVLLLFVEFLILAFTFTRFDVLTVFATVFTYSFCWQTYTQFVRARPLGSYEEWIAFAIWGLFVAAATAIAFKPTILAAYRRAAIAFQ